MSRYFTFNMSRTARPAHGMAAGLELSRVVEDYAKRETPSQP